MSAATIHIGTTGLPSAGRDARVIPFPAHRASAAGRPAAAAQEQRPTLRLTRRGRLAVTVSSLLLVTLAGALGAQTATGGTAAAEPTGLVSVTVLPGDTLWSIAQERGAGGDVRDVVAEIRSLNGLGSSQLLAGQVLLVPTS